MSRHIDIWLSQLGKRCYWHLVCRGQGCCWTASYSWDRPPKEKKITWLKISIIPKHYKCIQVIQMFKNEQENTSKSLGFRNEFSLEHESLSLNPEHMRFGIWKERLETIPFIKDIWASTLHSVWICSVRVRTTQFWFLPWKIRARVCGEVTIVGTVQHALPVFESVCLCALSQKKYMNRSLQY